LGHNQTIQRMKTDFFYPDMSDRSAMNDWLSGGTPSILENAARYSRTTLASHFPDHISAIADETIRREFDIFLAEEHCRHAA
jgi:trimethylamine--corrinoid protein Co-methyltransferase